MRNGYRAINVVVGVVLTVLLASGALAARTITYTYDELNRLGKVAYDDGPNKVYVYDSIGNRTMTKESPQALPEPNMVLVTSALDFGPSAPGVYTSPLEVELENNGTAALNIGAIYITGENRTAFEIVQGFDGCSGTSLAVSAGCTLRIRLLPVYGRYDATLHIPSDDPDSPATLSMTGHASTDTDGDGIPDQWELDNFGNLASVGATTDSDSDGISDGVELARGSDPFDINVAWAARPQFELGGKNGAMLKSDGSLWYWGLTFREAFYRFEALQAGVAGEWKQVSVGDHHVAAIKNDGTLWAWGQNANGQLGDDTHDDSEIPKQIGVGTWRLVAAGGSSTYAIDANGHLWAWGANSAGQLGDGTTYDRLQPTQIGNDADWSYVSAGGAHALAVTTDGDMFAWGDDSYGQLGNGGDDASRIPMPVGVAQMWVKAAAGLHHSLALTADGNLYAWGSNSSGQLGDGSSTDKDVPTVVAGTGWAAIAAGNQNSLAVKNDGTLWGWGLNYYADDDIASTNSVPTQVGAETDWMGASCGDDTSAAVKIIGTAYRWGTWLENCEP